MEAIKIDEADPASLMSSRSEFGANSVSRVVVQQPGEKSQGTAGANTEAKADDKNENKRMSALSLPERAKKRSRVDYEQDCIPESKFK